jgi:hypothetical protein
VYHIVWRICVIRLALPRVVFSQVVTIRWDRGLLHPGSRVNLDVNCSPGITPI